MYVYIFLRQKKKKNNRFILQFTNLQTSILTEIVNEQIWNLQSHNIRMIMSSSDQMNDHITRTMELNVIVECRIVYCAFYKIKYVNNIYL